MTHITGAIIPQGEQPCDYAHIKGSRGMWSCPGNSFVLQKRELVFCWLETEEETILYLDRSTVGIQWVFNEYLKGALKKEIHLSLKIKPSICKPQVLSVPTHHYTSTTTWKLCSCTSHQRLGFTEGEERGKAHDRSPSCRSFSRVDLFWLFTKF